MADMTPYDQEQWELNNWGLLHEPRVFAQGLTTVTGVKWNVREPQRGNSNPPKVYFDTEDKNEANKLLDTLVETNLFLRTDLRPFAIGCRVQVLCTIVERGDDVSLDYLTLLEARHFEGDPFYRVEFIHETLFKHPENLVNRHVIEVLAGREYGPRQDAFPYFS